MDRPDDTEDNGDDEVIADVYALCPMCRERKLHLLVSGVIRCLNRACPRPMAAQEILDGDLGVDIVQIDEGGFSILHPLRERLGGGLFDCPVNKALAAMGEPPALPGRYRATIGEDGIPVLAPLIGSPGEISFPPGEITVLSADAGDAGDGE
jgi:Family of unknown function (DUF6085)